MKKAPCAKLTMRMMPKISVRPTPRKNSNAACDSAFRHWVTRKPRKSILASSALTHCAARIDPGPSPGQALSRNAGEITGCVHHSAIERHLPARRRDFVAREGGDDLRDR